MDGSETKISEAHLNFEGSKGARGGVGDGVGVVRFPLQAGVGLTVAQVSNGQELHRALPIHWGCCEVVLGTKVADLHEQDRV